MEWNGNVWEIVKLIDEGLPDEVDDHIIHSSDDRWGQERTFDDQAVEAIADGFQQVIASTIAHLIDAGSERDAINEDEELHAALVRVLKEW